MNITEKWNSFTWPFRKFIYKIKMFHKFSPYLYMHWECTEAITFIPFEIFTDFYKQCIDIEEPFINWESDKCHSNAKKAWDEIYNYWTVLRPIYKKNEEWFLSAWAEIYHMNSTQCDDNKDLYELKFHYTKGYEVFGEQLSDRFRYYEDLIYKLDAKYLKMIIEYKDFMWE